MKSIVLKVNNYDNGVLSLAKSILSNILSNLDLSIINDLQVFSKLPYSFDK